MKNRLLDRGLLVVAVLLSLVITALDFTGALDKIPWLESRIPVMTLLVAGIVTLGVFTDGDRLAKIVDESHRRTQDELVARLGADKAGAAIIGTVESRWKERESEIHAFFADVLSVRSESALREKLVRYQKQFSEGQCVSGARLLYPWDLTVLAMDSTGRLSYHPNKRMEGTRPNLPHHREMLNDRNGECYWANQYLTPQLRAVLSVAGDPDFKVDRLTRVYYRWNRHVQRICIIESHLDVLYQLPLRNQTEGT